jgi:hypothetical protein
MVGFAPTGREHLPKGTDLTRWPALVVSAACRTGGRLECWLSSYIPPTRYGLPDLLRFIDEANYALEGKFLGKF